MTRGGGPDPVEGACKELSGLFPVLERLAGERRSRSVGLARPHRPAMVPEPYGQAGVILMTVGERLRRLEVSVRVGCRLPPSPMPDRRSKRPLTQEQTDALLAGFPKLAAGLDSRGRDAAARFLERQVNWVKSLNDIDEVRRWRWLPGWDDGSGLAPECPYCRAMWLRADMDAGIVQCWFTDCEGDESGRRATAVLGTDESGQPCITWADGRRQVVPDLGG